MSAAQAAKAVSEILSFSDLVMIKNNLRVIGDDPDDDRVLETAIEGMVDYIVSGDHHLLNLVTFQNIPIIRAVELLHKNKS